MNASQIAQIIAQLALVLINSQAESIERFAQENPEVKPAMTAVKQVVDALNSVVQSAEALPEPELPQA